MDSETPSGVAYSEPQSTEGPKIPVADFVVIVVGLQTLAWNVASYRLHGGVDPTYLVLSLFLSINLLICYWEACL